MGVYCTILVNALVFFFLRGFNFRHMLLVMFLCGAVRIGWLEHVFKKVAHSLNWLVSTKMYYVLDSEIGNVPLTCLQSK